MGETFPMVALIADPRVQCRCFKAAADHASTPSGSTIIYSCYYGNICMVSGVLMNGI